MTASHYYIISTTEMVDLGEGRHAHLMYTGGAGDRWTTTNFGEAFRYATREGAARRCGTLNRGTSLHKLTFKVEAVLHFDGDVN